MSWSLVLMMGAAVTGDGMRGGEGGRYPGGASAGDGRADIEGAGDEEREDGRCCSAASSSVCEK